MRVAGHHQIAEVWCVCVDVDQKEEIVTKHVDGEGIARHFEDKPIGTTMRLPGVLDGERFDLFCMKDEGYVMSLMSTYGSLQVKKGQKDSVRVGDNGERSVFKYREVIANHFDYRGAVDFHNSKRHDCGTKHGLSLEETWRTTNWTVRVFSFILAVTEVNAFLAMRYFGGLTCTQLEFRRKLAHEMVHNPYDVDGAKTRSLTVIQKPPKEDHRLITAKNGCRWVDGKWMKAFKNEFQQVKCAHPNCKKRIRTVCICSPYVFRCHDHFIEHMLTPSNDAIAFD